MNLKEISPYLDDTLFSSLPCKLAVMDKEFNVVIANHHFAHFFGPWLGKKCYELFWGNASPCENCPAQKTLIDNQERSFYEYGLDKERRKFVFECKIAPLKNSAGEITHFIQILEEIQKPSSLQCDYETLFEHFPGYITIIDRDFRIVYANDKFRRGFGDIIGEWCYRIYRGRDQVCFNCPAQKTFSDGLTHIFDHPTMIKTDDKIHYSVLTAPAKMVAGKCTNVIIIANEATELIKLEDQLRTSHKFRENLIENAWYGIIATDKEGKVIIFNPAARRILNYPPDAKLDEDDFRKILPKEFLEILNRGEGSCHLSETEMLTADGVLIPVRFTGAILTDRGQFQGVTVFIRDLRPLKKLEKEKLEAERMAAVGQTVASLAHSVKNILMGMEGGMYLLKSGLSASDRDKTSHGWEILDRNFLKISTSVREFLNFAKERLPKFKLVHPNDSVMAVVELYQQTAKNSGIELSAQCSRRVKPMPLDPEGLHTCLANLVSNALDACKASNKKDQKVLIRTRIRNKKLLLEVIDNGLGMDPKIKSRIFTTFFTTKGSQGTGLGLLTTKKILQDLGGTIKFKSSKNVGSNFKIEFPCEAPPPDNFPVDLI